MWWWALSSGRQRRLAAEVLCLLVQMEQINAGWAQSLAGHCTHPARAHPWSAAGTLAQRSRASASAPLCRDNNGAVGQRRIRKAPRADLLRAWEVTILAVCYSATLPAGSVIARSCSSPVQWSGEGRSSTPGAAAGIRYTLPDVGIVGSEGCHAAHVGGSIMNTHPYEVGRPPYHTAARSGPRLHVGAAVLECRGYPRRGSRRERALQWRHQISVVGVFRSAPSASNCHRPGTRSQPSLRRLGKPVRNAWAGLMTGSRCRAAGASHQCGHFAHAPPSAPVFMCTLTHTNDCWIKGKRLKKYIYIHTCQTN